MFSWKGPEFPVEVKVGFQAGFGELQTLLTKTPTFPPLSAIGPVASLGGEYCCSIAPGSMRQYQNVLPEASWVWMTKCSVRTEAIAAWKQ